MKKIDNKYRIIPSPFVFGGIIFMDILCLSVFLFVICMPHGIEQCNEHIWYWFALITMLIVFPLLCSILSARRFLAVFQFDETGISRSVFGKFYKLTMKWDEIAEISYFESLRPFLMFSKTVSIKGMSYRRIGKIKDLIQIELSPKRYDVVKQFIVKPINGLTEAQKAKLKLKD